MSFYRHRRKNDTAGGVPFVQTQARQSVAYETRGHNTLLTEKWRGVIGKPDAPAPTIDSMEDGDSSLRAPGSDDYMYLRLATEATGELICHFAAESCICTRTITAPSCRAFRSRTARSSAAATAASRNGARSSAASWRSRW